MNVNMLSVYISQGYGPLKSESNINVQILMYVLLLEPKGRRTELCSQSVRECMLRFVT